MQGVLGPSCLGFHMGGELKGREFMGGELRDTLEHDELGIKERVELGEDSELMERIMVGHIGFGKLVGHKLKERLVT